MQLHEITINYFSMFENGRRESREGAKIAKAFPNKGFLGDLGGLARERRFDQ